jgi:hypothetical protein
MRAGPRHYFHHITGRPPLFRAGGSRVVSLSGTTLRDGRLTGGACSPSQGRQA